MTKTELISAVAEKTDFTNDEIRDICKMLNVDEINIIRQDGKIVISSNDDYIGFDIFIQFNPQIYFM